MRSEYILLLRFFSGFRDLEMGVWNPYGPPTISKLLEFLDKKKIKSTAVLLCRDSIFFKGRFKPYYLDLKEFTYVRFIVLPFFSFVGNSRIDLMVTDFLHFLFSVKLILKERPRILYCVRASKHIAAFFCLFKKPKVVFRMMGETGEYDFYKRKLNYILYPITTFSLRAKYSCIINSIDGSPVRKIADECMHRKSRKVFLLNGVDKDCFRKDVGRVDPHNIKILYVGRLVDAHGASEFLEAVRRVSAKKNNFFATIIGYGEGENKIKRKIADCNLSGVVSFTGRVSHQELSDFYNLNDIFIFIGKLGNLGNSVLEAIEAGNCVTILEKGTGGIDEDTERLLPMTCVIRISRDDIVGDLSNKLLHLLNNPQEIEEYKKNAKQLSKTLLKSWDERMQEELDVINAYF